MINCISIAEFKMTPFGKMPVDTESVEVGHYQ